MAAENPTVPKDVYALPDAKVLQGAGELPVLTVDGKEVAFKTLYSDENASGRQLIVFIRHFFCGQCEEYIRALNQELSPSKLSALTPPVQLIVIGCGEPPIVAGYKQRTSCAFPIYCDPKRAIYTKLGMIRSLDLGDKKPDYIKPSLAVGMIKSAVTMITGGGLSFKGGDFSQNGGEWLFQDGELQWCKRMANTRDHAEIKELKEVLKL